MGEQTEVQRLMVALRLILKGEAGNYDRMWIDLDDLSSDKEIRDVAEAISFALGKGTE